MSWRSRGANHDFVGTLDAWQQAHHAELAEAAPAPAHPRVEVEVRTQRALHADDSARAGIPWVRPRVTANDMLEPRLSSGRTHLGLAPSAGDAVAAALNSVGRDDVRRPFETTRRLGEQCDPVATETALPRNREMPFVAAVLISFFAARRFAEPRRVVAPRLARIDPNQSLLRRDSVSRALECCGSPAAPRMVASTMWS